MRGKRAISLFEKRVVFGLTLCCVFLIFENPVKGKDRDEFFQTPGHRFLVMITERGVDYFQFKQDLSLTDKQMVAIREILRAIRRELIQQDSFLRIELEALEKLFYQPVLNEIDILAQLEVVEGLIKSEKETWIHGLEELQSILNKEQILTYAFIKGVPLPVMEFPQGQYEQIARYVMDRHGQLYLRKQKELALRERQIRILDLLTQKYIRDMVSRATFIEAGQFEIQDLVSEPVINFDALRKQVLENEKLRSDFFLTMVSYLVKAQDQLTTQQVKSLVQVWNQ